MRTGVLALMLLVALLAAMTAPSGRASVENDVDGDGCSDGEELGPLAVDGGQRDPNDFWDVYDVPTGLPAARDRSMNIGDIGGVVARFGATREPPPTEAEALAEALTSPPTAPAYHAAFDRGGPGPGGDLWDLRPPDGAVSVVDIASSVAQFGHTCLMPEVAGAWSSGAPLPTPRTEVASAALDGVIYVIGGFPNTGVHTDLVEAYDTAGDSWSTVDPLPEALDHAGAGAVGGKIYVVGGYRGQGSISDATYEFDPVADMWTTRASMPLPRAAAATVVVDGVIYVLGGVGPQETVPLAYDPVADEWKELAPMSAPREHLAAAAVGGMVYLVGGRENVFDNVGTLEAYDPVADAWQALAAMPTARGGLAASSLAGRVHVVGGEDLAPGGSTYPQHEVYDPASDGWQPAPPLPTPRHGLTAQTVDGKLYVIGGGPTPRLSVSGAVEIFEVK